jgi:hypothetical protein
MLDFSKLPKKLYVCQACGKISESRVPRAEHFHSPFWDISCSIYSVLCHTSHLSFNPQTERVREIKEGGIIND